MNVYEGTQNYIFVSYAHKDSDKVLPIIEALQKANFRVWFDSGIEAGTEWPAYIEEHLTECARMLVFISPAAVASPNCRNEISLAASLNKQMLVVYLEDTKLAQGMNLQLNASQSLFRERHKNLKSFVNELTNAKILQCCKIGMDDNAHMDLPDFSDEDFLSDFDDFASNTPSVPDENSLAFIKNSHKNGPALISYVAIKGAEQLETLWPTTKPGRRFNLDKYRELRFIINFMRPFSQEGNYTTGLMIYDSAGNLILENISEIYFEENTSLCSKGWHMRDDENEYAAPGIYRAILWVNDSRVYECQFELTSAQQESSLPDPSMPGSKKKAQPDDKLLSKLAKRKRWLKAPTVLLAYLAQIVLWASAFFCSIIWSAADDMLVKIVFFLLMLLSFLLILAATVAIVILSHEFVFSNWWLSVLCPVLFPRIYCIGLIGFSVYVLAKRSEWIQQINAYAVQ